MGSLEDYLPDSERGQSDMWAAKSICFSEIIL